MFINNCQIDTLTTDEFITIEAYEVIENLVKSYIEKGYKQDLYALKGANSSWDLGNDLFYLLTYLQIVRSSIIRDIQSCNKQSFEYYKDKFKLDCIKKYFACKSTGIDISALYNIFGVGSPVGYEGIAYMAIGFDDTPICNETNIFEVGQTEA